MTEEKLITDVRASLGKNIAAYKELDDTEIVIYSTNILERISDAIPSKALRYITSVANQRDYDVPSTVLRVQKLFQWDAVEPEQLLDLGSCQVTEATSSEYYNFPSTWAIKMARKIAGLPRIQHTFDPITRKLSIDPHPLVDGDKYYYQSVEKSKWTVENLPADFNEVLILGTSWKSLEQIALKRAELGGTMRADGRVTYPATEIFNLAEKRKDEFTVLLQVKSLKY